MSRGASNGSYGVNPAAARLQHRQNGVLRLAPWIRVTPCPYEHHRESDWRKSAEHPWVCGVCHPPVRGKGPA
jgi:hypothetical protein